MSCMHERLRAVYNQYATKFFDEKLRSEHGIEPDNQMLILPGEEGTDGECNFAKMFELPTAVRKDTAVSAAQETSGSQMPQPEPTVASSVVVGPSNNQDEEVKESAFNYAAAVEESQCNIKDDDDASAFESFSERKGNTVNASLNAQNQTIGTKNPL